AVPVMAINWMFNIGILWLIQSILKRLGVSVLWILIVLLCFVADINVIFWANSGMETPILAFLVTLCVWALSSKRYAPFLLSLSAIPLVRSDSIILALALGIVFLWQERLTRKALILLALTTLPAVVQLLFRVVYYANLMPNPYYLKVTGSDLLGLNGLRYAFRFLTTYGLLALLLPVTALLIPRLRVVVFICCVQIAYFILIGGDAFQFVRFAVPILPLIYLCAVVCLFHLAKNRDQSARFLAVAYLLFATPLLGDLFTFPNNVALGWLELGVLIEDNTPPNTVVAISAAGTAPYFADQQRFVDLLGVTDAHIAHVTPAPELGVLGHNKFDFTYIYQVRKPDVLHTDSSCQQAADLLASLSPDNWESYLQTLPPDQDVHDYFEILNADFVRDYFPNPVSIDLQGQRGCLYLRTGSTLPHHWQFTDQPQ
ncbi:MAG: hypothetical protein ABI835_12565, partial [Chloroflexota bacterium]